VIEVSLRAMVPVANLEERYVNAAVLIFPAILMVGLGSPISLNPVSGFPGPRHDCQNQEASNIKMY
jgi:hypothetical protein